MSGDKASAPDPLAEPGEARAPGRAQREAHIAKLQGEIAELELLICNLALTDRDTSDLQDDLRRRMDDLAEAIGKRIELISGEKA